MKRGLRCCAVNNVWHGSLELTFIHCKLHNIFILGMPYAAGNDLLNDMGQIWCRESEKSLSLLKIAQQSSYRYPSICILQYYNTHPHLQLLT